MLTTPAGCFTASIHCVVKMTDSDTLHGAPGPSVDRRAAAGDGDLVWAAPGDPGEPGDRRAGPELVPQPGRARAVRPAVRVRPAVVQPVLAVAAPPADR